MFNPSQEKVLEASGNILVNASAGSGKTTVMIEKIYRLIMQGYNINRMVVMTFSRASASDMKNKLVKKLYESVRKGGEEGTRAMKELASFPFANICTIDSFCYGLMKKYYAVIGADPSCTPLDPDQSDIIWDECVDKACEEGLNNKEFVDFAKKYTSARNLSTVKKLITALKNFLASQLEENSFRTDNFHEKRLEYLYNEYSVRLKELLTKFQEVIFSLRECDMPDEEKNILSVKLLIEEMLLQKDREKFLKIPLRYEKLRACTKKKEQYTEGKESYNRLIAEINIILPEIASFGKLLPDADDQVKMLFFVTDIAIKLYSDRKKRDGKLDFNDLSRIALEILQDEATADEIKNSYDFIFVDEYQDTNYLQEKLLYGINRDNVFVVGDIKQAIYQFRYAEPQIFMDRLNKYFTQGVGQNIYLNENYRSKKSILDFVNLVCGEIFTESYCGIDYKQNPMIAGADYREEESGVEVYQYEKQKTVERPDGIYSVKDAVCEEEKDIEGEFIANRILSMVGKEYIYRPKVKQNVSIGYGDIAILTRKGAEGVKIASILEKKHIPYTIFDTDEGIYAPRELLVDFLRLCICTDDIPIINVLSCPMFGFTATELIEVSKRDTKMSIWEAIKQYNGQISIKNKLEKFLLYAENLREISSYLTCSDIMTKVLNDGLDGYFDSVGNGTGGRVRRFLSTVSGLGCNTNVTDFIEYYDNSYKGEKPPAQPDSVVIMTMHKSKGLEFPIVFLPYSDSTSEQTAFRIPFFADKDLGIALKYIDENKAESKDTFATAVLKRKKLIDGRKELARLMYVDFTRAENKLIITGKKGKEANYLFDANSIMSFLQYSAQKNPKINDYFHEMPTFAEEEKTEEEKVEDIYADFSYLTEKYPFERSTVLPNKQTVTEILSEEKEQNIFGKTKNPSDPALGTAYHLFMQKADLSQKNPIFIKNQIDKMVLDKEILPEIAEKMDIEKIELMLSSDIIKTALNNNFYRELPFIGTLKSEDGYTLIQGVIDLLIEEEDGLTVVDFKASGLDEKKLAEKYKPQLDLYAEAIEGIFKKKVRKKVLLNILKNYTVEV